MDESSSTFEWRKSTYSGQGDCLEWAIDGQRVRLRSSRSRQGPELSLTRSEWAAFLAGAKAGEADL